MFKRDYLWNSLKAATHAVNDLMTYEMEQEDNSELEDEAIESMALDDVRYALKNKIKMNKSILYDNETLRERCEVLGKELTEQAAQIEHLKGGTGGKFVSETASKKDDPQTQQQVQEVYKLEREVVKLQLEKQSYWEKCQHLEQEIQQARVEEAQYVELIEELRGTQQKQQQDINSKNNRVSQFDNLETYRYESSSEDIDILRQELLNKIHEIEELNMKNKGSHIEKQEMQKQSWEKVSKKEDLLKSSYDKKGSDNVVALQNAVQPLHDEVEGMRAIIEKLAAGVSVRAKSQPVLQFNGHWLNYGLEVVDVTLSDLAHLDQLQKEYESLVAEKDALQHQVHELTSQLSSVTVSFKKIQANEVSIEEIVKTLKRENEELAKKKSNSTISQEKKEELTSRGSQSDMESMKVAMKAFQLDADKYRKLSSLISVHLTPLVISLRGKGSENSSAPSSPSIVAPEDFINETLYLLQRFQKEFSNDKILLKQWEQKYDQACQMHGTVSEQLQQTWTQLQTTIQNLAERDAQLEELKRNGGKQLRELERAIEQAEQDVSLRREEKQGLEKRVSEMKAVLDEFEEENDQLKMEVNGLKNAKTTAENLEILLEQLQIEKQDRIEKTTAELNAEIESLRKQLFKQQQFCDGANVTENARGDNKGTLPSSKGSFSSPFKVEIDELKKEILTKNSIISTLQYKQNEMRRLLQETMAKLHDDFNIDKRIVSQLLVNYINSCYAKRGDEEDIVKVMAGLLDWDEELMERSGLTDGSKNPKRLYKGGGNGGSKMGKKFIKGVLSSLWGDPSAVAKAHGMASSLSSSFSEAITGRLEGENGEWKSKTLAEGWVEFLMKESEMSKGAQREDQTKGDEQLQ